MENTEILESETLRYLSPERQTEQKLSCGACSQQSLPEESFELNKSVSFTSGHKQSRSARKTVTQKSLPQFKNTRSFNFNVDPKYLQPFKTESRSRRPTEPHKCDHCSFKDNVAVRKVYLPKKFQSNISFSLSLICSNVSVHLARNQTMTFCDSSHFEFSGCK